jgi:hypothetical protein
MWIVSNIIETPICKGIQNQPSKISPKVYTHRMLKVGWYFKYVTLEIALLLTSKETQA